MYALLDIERTIRGLPELEAVEFYDANDRLDGYLWWSDKLRHKPLRELTQTLRVDLDWLNEKGISADERRARGVVFVLGGPSLSPKSITVALAAEDQTVLLDARYGQHAIATISFDGNKDESELPSEHPAYSKVINFLTHIQPIHAFVIGDSMSPAHDLTYFRQQWKHVVPSTFLGPELLPFIPAHLLTLEAGFVHLERLGAGLWMTFPGDEAKYGGKALDYVARGRLWQACYAVEAFLEMIPSFLASERE